MALVRCSCVTSFAPRHVGGVDLDVLVLDPDCGYVVHRLGTALGGGSSSDDAPAA